MGNTFPLNCVEVELCPGALHVLQIVVQCVLTECKVSLGLKELDVLLSAFHVAKRLLCNVGLLTVSNLLGHLLNVDFLEALGSQRTNDGNLLLELHEPLFLALSKLLVTFEAHLLEGILHFVHHAAKLLELTLNIVSVELVNRCLEPFLIALLELSKSFPEIFIGLNVLLALF